MWLICQVVVCLVVGGFLSCPLSLLVAVYCYVLVVVGDLCYRLSFIDHVNLRVGLSCPLYSWLISSVISCSCLFLVVVGCYGL